MMVLLSYDIYNVYRGGSICPLYFEKDSAWCAEIFP